MVISMGVTGHHTGPHNVIHDRQDFDHDGFVDLLTLTTNDGINWTATYHNGKTHTNQTVAIAPPTFSNAGPISGQVNLDFNGDGLGDQFKFTYKIGSSWNDPVDNLLYVTLDQSLTLGAPPPPPPPPPPPCPPPFPWWLMQCQWKPPSCWKPVHCSGHHHHHHHHGHHHHHHHGHHF
jgi:hypothetical protein